MGEPSPVGRDERSRVMARGILLVGSQLWAQLECDPAVLALLTFGCETSDRMGQLSAEVQSPSGLQQMVPCGIRVLDFRVRCGVRQKGIA
eukprot:2953975-Rhodomonas_salina.2